MKNEINKIIHLQNLSSEIPIQTRETASKEIQRLFITELEEVKNSPMPTFKLNDLINKLKQEIQ